MTGKTLFKGTEGLLATISLKKDINLIFVDHTLKESFLLRAIGLPSVILL
jgi:hypothetical protein